MKITVTGDAFVVKSSLKAADIELVKKYAPDALAIKDKDGNDLFTMNYKEGAGSIASFGVTFGGKTRDEEALATYTGTIPTSVKDAKEYVAEKVGAAAPYIEQLEKSVKEKADEVSSTRKKLVESITVA